MSKLFLVFGVLILAIILFTIWIGFSTWNDGATSSAEVQMTPQAGGTSLPTSTPTVPSTPPPAATAVITQTTQALTPGQSVILESNGAQAIPMYADASASAPLLDLYPAGATLTILEPSGDYQAYPVEKDGAAWYRVRDTAGLVGWIDGSLLTPSESSAEPAPPADATATPTG